MTFNIDTIRAQFPILSREINGKPLAYLDNAASAQKPRAVIDAMAKEMSHAITSHLPTAAVLLVISPFGVRGLGHA